MVERVYITQEQTTTFTLPICQFSKTVDVSKFMKSVKKVKINVKCPCGHAFKSLLERRKQYRKEINLTGSFVHFVANKPAGDRNMRVRDLSLTGEKLEVYENFHFSEGVILEIEFRLDDLKKTPIKRKVVIRNIQNSYLGAEFIQTGYEDKALGFYLMP